MSVKEFFSNFTQEPISREVCGRNIRFYEVPYRKLAGMHSQLTTLFQSVSALLYNFDEEAGSQHVLDAGRQIEEKLKMAKPVELSQQHLRARNDSIARLVKALTESGGLEGLCAMLMASMRDEFENYSKADVAEFADNVTVPQLTAMIVFLLEANKRMFDPFRETAARVGERLKLKLLGNEDLPADEEADQSQGDSTEEDSEHSLDC